MQDSQINKPLTLVMDKHYKHLSETEAYYLLNHERYVNIHGSKSDGATIGKTTPFPANYPACEIDHPAGETYCVGTYRSPITNEVYSWHYNSNGAHYILRITDEGCEIVNDNECLKISADPKRSIENWRAYLKVEKFDPDCGNQHGKQLIWTDGSDENLWQVDVEASIATDSFRTPFFERCNDGCSFMKNCVPEPCGCLHAEYIPLPQSEAGLSNKIIDKGFQFMYRYVYYDNRASSWSDRSTLYFQDVKGCFGNAEGFPRCMKLRVPIGNPLVEKIEIAFTENGVNWKISDTIEKYKKYTNSQQKWYERDLAAELLNYSDDDCSFDYIFCNDKNCDEIDPKEITNVFIPTPREIQGIIPIKNALGAYNYKKGVCPVDRKEVEKFDIKLNCTDTITECAPEFVKVKVRAIIHNTTFDRNQFIYRANAGDEDDKSDPAKFGGLNRAQTNGDYQEPTGYGQYFRGDKRNFTAHIEATDYYVEMKQYKAWAFFDSYNDPILTGVVPDMDDVNTQIRWRRAARHGEFFFQEAEFNVPKGMKGFVRLISHQSTTNDSDSSTFVVGTLSNIRTYKGDANINSEINRYSEEIYFDTCSDDVEDGVLEIFEAFVIQDNALDAANNRKSSSYYGYIKDENNRPVEGAVVVPYVNDAELPYFQSITDHNGFYHLYLENGEDGEIDLKIRVEKDCYSWDIIKTVTISSDAGAGSELNIKITKDDFLPYKSNSTAVVKMKVQDCDGLPVGGIRVALSGSKYKITGADGFAEFKIRNYNTRTRNVTAIVMDYKNCFSISCSGDCNPCMPSQTASTPSCYVASQQPVVTLPTVTINKDSATTNRKGLKNGGRYPFGIIVKGSCGRHSAVYDITYLDIPRAQQSGIVRYCDFSYNSNGAKFPSWGTCVSIVRGKNVNPFELQWLVDKIERTSDGKIRLTIQSLNDYNAKYGFKSNTIYQYLKGDRIEFIKNGDGKIFSASQYGILNYLTISPFHDEILSGKKSADVGADFFNQVLIDDDGKLDDLKEGALIEMQRSKECTTEPEYYEICASIPLVDGELVEPSGTFSTFDTYLVNRTVGSFPSQTFEHHSPSDFWGDRLDDTGKAHFVNKYENEKRYGRNLSINAAGQYNYFGDLEKTFEAPEQGDIVAMDIKDGKIILAICENGNFLAQASDDLVRVGADGTIRALPADAIVSDGQPKVAGKYGCQYPHIGSIYFGDGYASWIDINKHSHIVHDYSIARVAGTRTDDQGKVITMCASYFMKRCQEIETFNRKQTNFLNHYRFVTGRNSQSGALIITIKKLRDSSINNSKEPYKKPMV